MGEITGKIQWLPDQSTEFPAKSGDFNIGIKVKDLLDFFGLHKLEKIKPSQKTEKFKIIRIGRHMDIAINKFSNPS